MRLIRLSIYSIIFSGAIYIVSTVIRFLLSLFNTSISPWDYVLAVIIVIILGIWYLDRLMGRR
jgi:putative Mn2+ efflux pump MntP